MKECYSIVWIVEKTEIKNLEVSNTSKEKFQTKLSKCAVCDI